MDGRENRDKNGRFVKGNSANPGGRKKIPEEFKALAKEKSLSALQAVVRIAENPDSEPKDVISASRLIIEYAYGKPVQDTNASLSLGADFVLEITDGNDPA